VDATAIYERTSGRPRFSILSKESDVKLNGRSYGLAANHTAAGDHLKLRAKRLARSGFASMIRPFAALRKPQIYLLDPYDPNKIPLLMVHGLQSTPVAFAALVSSSQNRLWSSVFRVPASRVNGDREAIRELQKILVFGRNPRVVRVIFVAAPHRGSPMADSFIGLLGNSLTRLDPMLEYGFNRIARENPGALTPKAAAFYKRGRFSGVRTLSPKSSALIALSELPIEVPYHSVIGQHHPGPKEEGSDGVVPYWSSHLDGAQSEVIARSGHAVLTNPNAVRETIRILHLELRSPNPSTRQHH
jgi:hypothetical protein